MADAKERMIQDIINVVKANQLPTTGDLFFGLVFRSETELKKICQELHIKTN
jgi:hypothetical protein